ncbi:cyclase [Mycobacterium sp. MS1601]|uniref:cyclase family protein n=1 Tax=Mycobacterium sp. MS1601 TaxID=1936029 RepID=UPI000979186E|nr:cyclase family protein [Mycobacterium sp. MS1601]AQA04618.1 cyclase [Mycobacterium sp. MS1601]
MRHDLTSEQYHELQLHCRNWGRWGPDDEIGTANLIEPGTVLRAASLVRTGQVYPLALPLDRNGPQTGQGLTGRSNIQHYMARDGGDIAAAAGLEPRFDGTDDVVQLYLQAGTQWDALAHAFYDNQMYNGRPTTDVTSAGAARNAVTGLADRAVGRGVLLDVARDEGVQWLEPGTGIDSGDLQRCADRQGVEVGAGDFLLVRTGQLAQVRDRGSWADYAGGDAPGLSVDATRFLCSRDVAAVAADTWGLEVRPSEGGLVNPVHVLLMVNAGIHLGEMWDMEALAADCAADNTYEFLVVAPPLNITGAVGSPVTPLAIR